MQDLHEMSGIDIFLNLMQQKKVDFNLYGYRQLIKTAQHHRLTGVLYQYLKVNPTAPTQLVELFKQAQQKNCKAALSQMAMLLDLHHLFEKNNFPFLVLKGLPLSQRLYGDIVTRQSIDIDILINVDQLLDIDNVLQQAGYQPIFHNKLLPRHVTFLQKSHHDLLYIHKKWGFRLELHFQLHLQYNLMIPFLRLWQDRQVVMLMNKEFHVLSKDQEWLYLCVHGSKHGWVRLQWLHDIAQYCSLLPQEEIEDFYLNIKNQAAYYGVERYCDLALIMIQHYFPFLFSVKKIAPSLNLITLKKLTIKLINHHERYKSGTTIPLTTEVTQALLAWNLMNRWIDRFNFILHRPRQKFWKQWTTTRFPIKLYFLCYPLYLTAFFINMLRRFARSIKCLCV